MGERLTSSDNSPKRSVNGAMDLSKLQDTFIRNVSHELRMPLTIIQGYVELLRDGELGGLVPEQHQAMLVISRHIGKLRDLVEQLGVLLAAEAKRSASLPLVLSEVVESVLIEKHTAASKAGVVLGASLEPCLPLVVGDSVHLQQAIGCLVDNAIKFTPKGGRVEIDVRLENNWVCLTVADTGVGIEEENLERIFERFYQADLSLTREYGGVGLGLSVVKAVVNEHNGRIEVTSQVGEGSRFTVRLPVLLPAGEIDWTDGRGETPWRILIVDDEASVVLTLQDGLACFSDCEITIATNGKQALELFERQPFDLLITDYRMPGLTGLELVQAVRRSSPDTRLILMTAYGSPNLRDAIKDLGIVGYLDKPFTISRARELVRHAIQ